jgi:hypothetical protein
MNKSVAAYRRQIEAALQYTGGTHTFDDVCVAVEAGRLQFWPGPRSVIITEILEDPQCRTLNFFLAGGSLVELEAMAPGILEWGKAQGCTRAVMLGRKGWERSFLTRTGWTLPDMVVLEKVL